MVHDKDLEIEDVLIAAPCMLMAMEQADWACDCVQMLTNFYAALTDHAYHSSDKEVEKRTWVLYQAEQHIQWHLTIPSPEGTWDIGILSTVLMASTCAQVIDVLRERSERDYG